MDGVRLSSCFQSVSKSRLGQLVLGQGKEAGTGCAIDQVHTYVLGTYTLRITERKTKEEKYVAERDPGAQKSDRSPVQLTAEELAALR